MFNCFVWKLIPKLQKKKQKFWTGIFWTRLLLLLICYTRLLLFHWLIGVLYQTTAIPLIDWCFIPDYCYSIDWLVFYTRLLLLHWLIGVIYQTTAIPLIDWCFIPDYCYSIDWLVFYTRLLLLHWLIGVLYQTTAIPLIDWGLRQTLATISWHYCYSRFYL